MNETIETVKAEMLPIPQQAKMIVVRDEGSLKKANAFFLDIKALRRKISDVFNPIIEKAHAAHKEALFQKAQTEAPLIEAEKYLNGQITVYNAEQDRKRAEEAERNRQEALKVEAARRKEEEERKIKEAADLEAAGLQEEAQALVDEVIEDLGKPVEVYVPPPETPRVKLDGMSMVTTWKAEVVNLKELCLAVGQGRCPMAYVDANMPALNKQATSLKGEMKIPGCKAVPDTKSRATGRRAA